MATFESENFNMSKFHDTSFRFVEVESSKSVASEINCGKF